MSIKKKFNLRVRLVNSRILFVFQFNCKEKCQCKTSFSNLPIKYCQRFNSNFENKFLNDLEKGTSYWF